MVKNLFKNGTDFLFRRQTNILSAAAVMAAAVLASRLLGLLKYRLLTDRFSVSDIGLFIAAFRLPNTVFDLVVMGALTTAFIPVFTSYLAKNKPAEADKIGAVVLNISVVFFLVLSLIFCLFTEPILKLTVPGLTADELFRVVIFTRIMLVGQTLPLILGNFLTGILQSHKRFLVPALAPVVYNLGIIAGIFFLSPFWGLYGAVFGVVLGAFLFLAIQVPFLRQVGFRYAVSFNIHHPGVTEVGCLIGPRAVGLAVTQLNYFANLMISSLISLRAITIFSFAQQLAQLPIGIFAATISSAALPTLAEEETKDDRKEAFKKTFLSCFHQILFLVAPIAAVLIVLRVPVVRLVYGASQFDWPATVDTGRALGFFGLALIGEAIVNLVVRAFYALHDSKTPVLLGTISVAVNIILAIAFVFLLPPWNRSPVGLAVAAAGADLLYALLLLFFLRRRIHLALHPLILPAGKILLSALVTGVALYIPMKLLDQLVFDTTRTLPLLALTGVASATGLAVYLFTAWLLDISEARPLWQLLGRAGTLIFAAEKTVAETVSPPAAISQTSASLEEAGQKIS